MHNFAKKILNARHSPTAIFLAGLIMLQIVVTGIIFFDFATGRKWFAFYDIGSDTYFQFLPFLIQQARELASGASPGGWSFEMGLGGSVGVLLNPFIWINIAFGPESVETLRFWVFALKLSIGGCALYAALLELGRTPPAAAVVALAYSFSGFVLVDGQWDPHATEAALYPVVLWSVARYLRRRNVIALPLAIALSVFSGLFPFSLGVFLAFAFVGWMICADAPGRMAKQWILGVFPLALLGLALAGPLLAANVLQILDSPRVTGAQSLSSRLIDEAFGFNDGFTIVTQIASLFHKDLLGIGSSYQGWMNYLEGPVFFVGLLPILAIPQLWFGKAVDRRAVVAGALLFIAVLVFPALRFAAFGFALPYFRVNNLWVSLLLLLLAARGLEIILDHRARRWLVILSATTLATLLAAIAYTLQGLVNAPHLIKIFILLGAATVTLLIVQHTATPRTHSAMLLLAVTAATAAWVGHPSVNSNRFAATPMLGGYRDATLPALELIRQHDRSPFYRVEKTFNSVSLCDSLAQGYRGVKSYWFQGSSMVRLYIELGLIPPRDSGVNYTNWLPNFGDRFALYSLVGVKYMISRYPLNWPGLRHLASGYGVHVFENERALPLGVVYTHQIPAEALATMPLERKDLLLLHAAVVDTPLGDRPSWFDPRALDAPVDDFVGDRYFAPIARLQANGLMIESFSDDHITGRVNPAADGVLALSIPYSAGWSIRIDDIDVPVYRVNYGFIGTPISAGPHRVELRYQTPGQSAGLLSAAAGLLILGGVVAWKRRQTRRDGPQTRTAD